MRQFDFGVRVTETRRIRLVLVAAAAFVCKLRWKAIGRGWKKLAEMIETFIPSRCARNLSASILSFVRLFSDLERVTKFWFETQHIGTVYDTLGWKTKQILQNESQLGRNFIRLYNAKAAQLTDLLIWLECLVWPTSAVNERSFLGARWSILWGKGFILRIRSKLHQNLANVHFFAIHDLGASLSPCV